ncbi:MAG: hypothetical protein OEM94_02170 [Acidimicrobiia bacterium]|nr:hypothetical protein [Acidimicrobiia bacterium]
MTTTAKAKVKRHPIRGAIFGLLLGIGTAALLIMYAVIALGTLTPIFVIVAGIVVGILWGMFGPVKTTRELPPSRLRTMPEAKTAPGASQRRSAPADDTEGAEGDGEGETESGSQDSPA